MGKSRQNIFKPILHRFIFVFICHSRFRDAADKHERPYTQALIKIAGGGFGLRHPHGFIAGFQPDAV